MYPKASPTSIHPIHIYHSTLCCTSVSWVNFEYPENKAVTLRGFGMSKSGTNLLPKMLLQVAQVRQQFSEFPAFRCRKHSQKLLF